MGIRQLSGFLGSHSSVFLPLIHLPLKLGLESLLGRSRHLTLNRLRKEKPGNDSVIIILCSFPDNSRSLSLKELREPLQSSQLMCLEGLTFKNPFIYCPHTQDRGAEVWTLCFQFQSATTSLLPLPSMRETDRAHDSCLSALPCSNPGDF